MSFDFLNPWLLAGLAGIALPILAHLLSKKKYEVVNWGAMQFLELGRETRRRVRLEELLLLLLRSLLIILIVFVFSRPWVSGGFFKHLVSAQPRDVVLVIDGSFSMGWQDGLETPHQQAIDWAREFLNDLGTGDTVALIDAREQSRLVIEKPTRDLEWVREELRTLPPPSGGSNLPEAISQGVRILSQTTNLDREILVLTDGQSRPWSSSDAGRWLRYDDLLSQPAVRPRVWCVDVTGGESSERVNLTVGPLQLSRELTVKDFPVRVSTTIGYTGGSIPLTKRVDLQVNGETIPGKSITVQLQPEGETTVEFEYRFSRVGSFTLGVAVEGDALPGDNLSLAAIEVDDALPVLLVDGDRRFDPTKSETFFAQMALSPSVSGQNWVRATIIDPAKLQTVDLDQYRVVMLANVDRLAGQSVDRLRTYVAGGGSLFSALGDRCQLAFYNETLFEAGLFPALLRQQSGPEVDTEPAAESVSISLESLELPWLKRFQNTESTFIEARFDRWWEIDVVAPVNEDPDAPEQGEPVTMARFSNQEPFLVSNQFGRGRVMVMTTPLDADWGTLPAKPDYVPFLHEAVFYLSAAGVERNLLPGMPFVKPVPLDFDVDSVRVFLPGGVARDVQRSIQRERTLIRFAETQIPGLYSLEPPPQNSSPEEREFFVVDFDREESDLETLSETERGFLTSEDRLSFVDSHGELREQLLTDTSRAELWRWVLFLFLGFLVLEVWMTRRLVQGGHMTDPSLESSTSDPNHPTGGGLSPGKSHIPGERFPEEDSYDSMALN